jgi:hypothetical protein
MDNFEIRDPVPALIGPVVIADGWSVDPDGAIVFSDEEADDVWNRFQARVSVSRPDPGIRCPYSRCGWLRRSRDPDALTEYQAHALNNHSEE